MEIYSKKYVPLISDAGFKAVFACHSNRELLKELLNHLLPEEVTIDEIVEYCDREQPQDTVNSKRSLLDLICRGADGSHFIVEVQDEHYTDFFQRVVYYAAGGYHLPLMSGESYRMLRPVYVVSILNHKLVHDDESLWDTDNVVSHYDFMERRTKEFAGTTISVTFAELARFTKSLEECSTDLDYLFWWFLHGQSFESVPAAISGRPFLHKVATACEYAAFTDEQKLKYENDMINELDKQYAISENYAKGFAEGEVKGEARGKAQRNIEIAKAMKAEGLTIEQIAKITGMQVSEIEVL
ncbi:MAG: Rpn family recombination-promoting nuclease/putative transposase [Bacteroidales bacterium]|nr:Rpn family recombination-promoting nuclease/putative transposase [Bacteroidales bacterium]